MECCVMTAIALWLVVEWQSFDISNTMALASNIPEGFSAFFLNGTLYTVLYGMGTRLSGL